MRWRRPCAIAAALLCVAWRPQRTTSMMHTLVDGLRAFLATHRTVTTSSGCLVARESTDDTPVFRCTRMERRTGCIRLRLWCLEHIRCLSFGVEALCERTHMLVPWWARVVSLSAFGGCTSPTENLMGLESRSSLTPLLSTRDHDGPHVFGAFVA